MYVGHVSHSTVNVPLAYQRRQRLNGQRLLATIVAANECAARIGAAATLGPFRGQTAAHVQLVGAVAARLHLARAPERQWVDALGIALSAPPWWLRRAFVGSDAKVLSAATAVRTGLDAYEAAAAGLGGAPDILEHPDGFLAKFAEAPTPGVVVSGLGERWHTETLSVKMHPAGAYVDAAIDCASQLHRDLTAQSLNDIVEVVVRAPRLTLTMDSEGSPYLDGDQSAIMALNVSVAYNVATALMMGSVGLADLAPPATADPARWALARQVRLEYDPGLSRSLLAATAPLGEALREAGERGRGWFAAFSGGRGAADLVPDGPPSRTFENATKAIGSQVRVRLRDGRELIATRDAADGSAGPRTRDEHGQLARRKLMGSGAPGAAADALAQVGSLKAADLDRAVLAAMMAGRPAR